MRNTTTYNQGEVVLVPFPFSDEDTVKRRPAVVVSAHWYNQCREDCILVAITSTVSTPLERDEVLVCGAEVTRAGLRTDAVVRAGKIFTIERSRILKPLGYLAPATLQKVTACLQDVFFSS